MKKFIKHLANYSNNKLWLIVVLVVTLVGATMLQQSQAAAGLYLTGPTKVQQNAIFTVALKLNTSQQVDGVEAVISYNTARVQFVSVDDTNSNFPIALLQSGGNGRVMIDRGKLDGRVSGDLKVANIRFKALANRQTSTIGLKGNATSEGKYINPLTTGMVVAFTKVVRIRR